MNALELCVCVCVQDVYVIAMEYLLRENYSLLDTVDDVSVWTLSDIKVMKTHVYIYTLYMNNHVYRNTFQI